MFRGKTRVHWDERMHACAEVEKDKGMSTISYGKRDADILKATENRPFIYVPSKKKFSLLG